MVTTVEDWLFVITGWAVADVTEDVLVEEDCFVESVDDWLLVDDCAEAEWIPLVESAWPFDEALSCFIIGVKTTGTPWFVLESAAPTTNVWVVFWP